MGRPYRAMRAPAATKKRPNKGRFSYVRD